MSSRGVHFALTEEQRQQLAQAATNTAQTPDERAEAVLTLVEAIEERWDRKNLFETDKAWDALHRCFTEDNTPKGRLNPEQGTYPLKLCFVGGTSLYVAGDWTINLIEPAQVVDLATALRAIDEPWVRERFFRLNAKATLYPINEREFQYAWGNFRGLPKFMTMAAKKKRAVLFTVDH